MSSCMNIQIKYILVECVIKKNMQHAKNIEFLLQTSNDNIIVHWYY